MAANGGMQYEDQEEYKDGYVEPFTAPGGPDAKGGNSCLTNQDEGDMIAYMYEQTPVRAADAAYQQDNTHLMGSYLAQSQDFGGS
jgi:hypothetical protein